MGHPRDAKELWLTNILHPNQKQTSEAGRDGRERLVKGQLCAPPEKSEGPTFNKGTTSCMRITTLNLAPHPVRCSAAEEPLKLETVDALAHSMRW